MKLGRTLVATFGCALAFAAADTPADIAPQGAVGALAVAPQGGRVLVGIDGARPGSWLYASDDGGGTWRQARGIAGPIGVTALAFAPSDRLDRLRGCHHAALRAARQRLLRLDRRRFDLARRDVEVDRRNLPPATPGRDRRDRRRSAPAAHRVRRHARSPAQEPERRRLVGGREGGASADPRHPIVTQPAARGGTRRRAVLRHRQALGTRPGVSLGQPRGPLAPAGRGSRPSFRVGRCWRWPATPPARG